MSKAASKPNIVFILSDDQGAWAMGCAGNPEIRTANLDRLAAEGMRFDNFFCASPVCSPARASLLTGRIPSQHGVHDHVHERHNPVEYLGGIPGYTDFLADSGYVCGISGKWHLGHSGMPQKGFTHWHVRVGGKGYYQSKFNRNGEIYSTDEYITDVITDDALAFLDRQNEQGDRPFYLSVHYTAPHGPWVGNHPKELTDSYDDCLFVTCPQEPVHPWTLASTVPPDVRTNTKENLKGYFAAVTAMDDNVGRILDKLEQLGLRENTLVCFTSDNGFNCGHHGVWGKGNGTFPQNMYDSSIKVPLIMSHPGHIAQGTVSDALVSAYDMMPTLLEYAGVDPPPGPELPGKSFVPILRGISGEGDQRIVVFDEYGPVRMIRTKEYKYVHRYPYGPNELYDLIRDPDERCNLMGEASSAQTAASLKAALDQWFIRYADPRVDGTREAVTGKGQIGLAGPAGQGAKAFNNLH